MTCSVATVQSTVQIELNWLLDDAVDAVQASKSGAWKPCTWRRLQSPAGRDASSLSVQSVALRADLETLTQLWTRRTQERSASCSLTCFPKRPWSHPRVHRHCYKGYLGP